MRVVMGRGILPSILLSQVRSTASWALESGSAAARVLEGAPSLDERYLEQPLDYLRVLLSAHYVTVATFCPTDVDAQIRHHVWWALEDVETFRAALAIVDEVAAWDPRLVSERVVASEGEHTCGHDGEWFSVRAGALGRALSFGDDASIAALVERIDGELAREAAIFRRLLRAGEPRAMLSAATVLAHNLGDLSRVVEAWPKSIDDRELRGKYVRLGHGGDHYEGLFTLAGAINKPIMAPENDRFLALREARPLRKSRALLLPIGPFFDGWGKTLATTSLLEDGERAQIVGALVDTHVRRPEQAGVLRALAGFHQAFRGGLDAVAEDVPARFRKLLRGGAIREHLGLDVARFEQRLVNKLDAVLAERGVPRPKRSHGRAIA